MALKGEGDARWIVSEREDGANVNNWHWRERDIFPWCKTKVTELFENLTLLSGPFMNCKTTKIVNVNGDATVANRKGRTICFYDISLKIDWECLIEKETEDDVKVEGQIKISDFCQDDDDMDVKFTCASETQSSREVREKLRKEGYAKVMEQKRLFCETLKQALADELSPQIGKTGKEKETAQKFDPIVKDNKSASSTNGKFKQEVHFLHSSVEEVFSTLLDSGKVSMFMQARATVSQHAGKDAAFSLLDGTISGHNVEIVENKRIVQSWRLGHWPAGHYSTVTLGFTPADSGCKMVLTQENIPAEELEKTQTGWERLFWARMRMVFGYEYKLKTLKA
eukprot:GCRY01004028.1.p1 GENE.GCRY01004028.1~~GCRY01004028.1.p1  ORF type:complete len:338 (-),score=39.26 GCRY01004028.1:279-1292(-)